MLTNFTPSTPTSNRKREEISPGNRALISYFRNIDRQPLKDISSKLQISIATCSRIASRSLKRAKTAKDSYHSSITALKPRSGAPKKLSEYQKDLLVSLATSNYTARRKQWLEIAQIQGIAASRNTISQAFKERGYSRYSPRTKPWLMPLQRHARLTCCPEQEH